MTKLESHLAIGGMLLALLATTTVSVAQPVITNQPTDQIGIAGATATFSVGATGTPPLTYQWRRHTNALGIATLTGETNSSLLLPNVQPTARRFGVIVTDGSGLSVTSILARLTVLMPPSITNQPLSQLAEVGDTVTLTVAATGTTPLNYQWRLNGTNLAGKTSTNLVLANVPLANAGNYSVVVTNLVGAATSQVAVLTVLPPVFVRITNGLIATDVGTGVGCVWGDYDNDGFLDLFVCNSADYSSGIAKRNVLYRNNGNGTFSKITNGVVVGEARDWRGCSWVDYDNDGFLDLFVTSINTAGIGAADFLYRNNADGTFRTINAAEAGAVGLWRNYN